MKAFLKIFFKIILALGVVAAGLTALHIWSENQADYIEIYNDSDDNDFDEGELYG